MCTNGGRDEGKCESEKDVTCFGRVMGRYSVGRGEEISCAHSPPMILIEGYWWMLSIHDSAV